MTPSPGILAPAIPATMKPQKINRLLAGEAYYRITPPLFSGDQALSFKVIDKVSDGDVIVDAMETLTDYSDPCPFHEWVQYGLEETEGIMVSVSDTDALSGFIVFNTHLEIDNIKGGAETLRLSVELERLYVAGTQRNKGYGRALIACVAAAADHVLQSYFEKNNGTNVNCLTVLISGDSLSLQGNRLLEITSDTMERQGLALVQSGKVSEFHIQNMTEPFFEEED